MSLPKMPDLLPPVNAAFEDDDLLPSTLLMDALPDESLEDEDDDTLWGDDGDSDGFSVNPATGLPMIGDSSLDVSGSVFGTDSSGFSSDW